MRRSRHSCAAVATPSSSARSARAGAAALFKGMERAFVPEKAGGFKGEVQYELDRGQGGRDWDL